MSNACPQIGRRDDTLPKPATAEAHDAASASHVTEIAPSCRGMDRVKGRGHPERRRYPANAGRRRVLGGQA